MKETIFRYAKSIRVRIISAFLAVLIIFAGLPFSVFRVNAETLTPGDGILTSTSTVSKYMGFTVGENNYTSSVESQYKYTGRLETVSVDMYDYLTDGEISEGNANFL